MLLRSSNCAVCSDSTRVLLRQLGRNGILYSQLNSGKWTKLANHGSNRFKGEVTENRKGLPQ